MPYIFWFNVSILQEISSFPTFFLALYEPLSFGRSRIECRLEEVVYVNYLNLHPGCPNLRELHLHSVCSAQLIFFVLNVVDVSEVLHSLLIQVGEQIDRNSIVRVIDSLDDLVLEALIMSN